MNRTPHRLRVHLAAWLHGRRPVGADSAQSPATCTVLFPTRARISADEAPSLGQPMQVTLALPGRRRAHLSGHVSWAMITTAPSLLCGEVDRTLGALFDLEFAPECADLIYVQRLFESRARMRAARVRRIARRNGVGPWLSA